jgi:hypothetical protein
MSHAAKARRRERSPGEVVASCPLPRHVTSAKYLNPLRSNVSGRHVTYFTLVDSRHVSRTVDVWTFQLFEASNRGAR